MTFAGGSVRLKMLVAIAALAMASGCDRDRPKLTECIDGRPAVERIYDVAPPNC